MFFNNDHLVNKIKLEKLQEKLRKSDMERRGLEFKFESLMKDRNKCEESAITSLKHRYDRFLDEDKKRTKRNEHLLKMLERIDYQAATLAAKTERLKMLKAQHELYLMKNWIPCHSIQSTISRERIASTRTSNTLSSFQNPQPHHTENIPQYNVLRNEINMKSDFVKYLSDLNQFQNENPIINGNKNIIESTYSHRNPSIAQYEHHLTSNQPQFEHISTVNDNRQKTKSFLKQPIESFSNNQISPTTNKTVSIEDNYKNPYHDINNETFTYLRKNLPTIEIIPPANIDSSMSTLSVPVTNLYSDNMPHNDITNINNKQFEHGNPQTELNPKETALPSTSIYNKPLTVSPFNETPISTIQNSSNSNISLNTIETINIENKQSIIDGNSSVKKNEIDTNLQTKNIHEINANGIQSNIVYGDGIKNTQPTINNHNDNDDDNDNLQTKYNNKTEIDVIETGMENMNLNGNKIIDSSTNVNNHEHIINADTKISNNENNNSNIDQLEESIYGERIIHSNNSVNNNGVENKNVENENIDNVNNNAEENNNTSIENYNNISSNEIDYQKSTVELQDTTNGLSNEIKQHNDNIINPDESLSQYQDYQNNENNFQEAGIYAENTAYTEINSENSQYEPLSEKSEYYEPYVNGTENYQQQQQQSDQLIDPNQYSEPNEMYNPSTSQYPENYSNNDQQYENYDALPQESAPLDYNQYANEYITDGGVQQPAEQLPDQAQIINDQNYENYQYPTNENYDEYQQYYQQNTNEYTQGTEQQQIVEQPSTTYYDENSYQQETNNDQIAISENYPNYTDDNFTTNHVDANQPAINEYDESSTTYSEDINVPSQPMFHDNEAPITENTIQPNYLDNETDESIIQQQNIPLNDENDFDFSTK